MTQYSDPIHRNTRNTRGSDSSRWKSRLSRWLGLIGLSAIIALPASAQAPAVPQHWISYAQLASNQFQAWLSDPADATVVRLHGALEARPATAPPSVVARVWVAPSGRIERLEFASLGDARADADLRAVLTAQSLSEPPPPDMRQPMVLELALSPAEPL